MKKTIIISTIIALTGFCLGMLTTCKSGKAELPANELQDTIFLSQWRTEKQKRINLIHFYETKVTKLEKGNDSLAGLVYMSRQAIATYRKKEKFFLSQLQEINAKDTATVFKEKLSGTIDSLALASENNDAACDTTIHLLEEKLANRDSTVLFHRNIEDNLREQQKDQELKNQYLTEQLNTAYKTQKRKTRQNKILAGGILILSGITTSILVTNSLR